MSFETYIFCDRLVPSVAAWQRQIEDLGFTLRLDGDRDLATAKGHLPASWNGYEAGFEFGPIALEDVLGTYNDFDFGGPWSHAYVFYWGSLPACISVPMAAAAYASAVQGLVFATSDGLVLTASEAVSHARSAEAQWPEFKALLDEQASGRP